MGGGRLLLHTVRIPSGGGAGRPAPRPWTKKTRRRRRRPARAAAAAAEPAAAAHRRPDGRVRSNAITPPPSAPPRGAAPAGSSRRRVPGARASAATTSGRVAARPSRTRAEGPARRRGRRRRRRRRGRRRHGRREVVRGRARDLPRSSPAFPASFEFFMFRRRSVSSTSSGTSAYRDPRRRNAERRRRARGRLRNPKRFLLRHGRFFASLDARDRELADRDRRRAPSSPATVRRPRRRRHRELARANRPEGPRGDVFERRDVVADAARPRRTPRYPPTRARHPRHPRGKRRTNDAEEEEDAAAEGVCAEEGNGARRVMMPRVRGDAERG